MNKYVEAALAGYDAARQDLEEYVRKNTDFAVDIDMACYPMTVSTLTPRASAICR